MNEINKKEIKQRGKGLLALVLAFMMMFGSSLTVLAANYTVGNGNNLTVGAKVNTGDTIQASSGGTLIIEIKGQRQEIPSLTSYDVFGEFTVKSVGSTTPYEVVLEPVVVENKPNVPSVSNVPSGPDVPEQQGGGGCSHNYQWVTVIEPFMTTDGLQQKMCTYCSAVEEKRVITASSYWVKEIIAAINAAPDNSTLEIEFPLYQCLTDKILKALEARETVSLRITFEDRTDPDNIVIRDVTIPAGQVSRAYNENQTNGLLYYGSVYGWN